jgi:hypothetical protein
MKKGDVIGTTHVGQNVAIENPVLNALEMRPDISFGLLINRSDRLTT